MMTDQPNLIDLPHDGQAWLRVNSLTGFDPSTLADNIKGIIIASPTAGVDPLTLVATDGGIKLQIPADAQVILRADLPAAIAEAELPPDSVVA